MTTASTTPVRRSRALLPLDLLRGALIGLAELVPGVSGGTVALVTGVYDALIESASHVVSAVQRLVTGPDRVAGAARELRRTDWWLVLPVLVGMAAAILLVAGVMASFVTDHPELARGLFLGLVAASIVVPVRMLPPRGARPVWGDALLVVVAAAVAWLLISLAGGQEVTDPPLVLVALAAAIAVCVLVVPGVSGSFFLLTVGLYTTTMTAVDGLDLGYLAVFAVGALVGLGSFVQLLRWLLTRHRRGTLLVMTGLMAGSLRALWPWQTAGQASSDGEVHGPGALALPYEPVAGPVALALLGAAVVVVLVVVETRLARHPSAASAGDPVPGTPARD